MKKKHIKYTILVATIAALLICGEIYATGRFDKTDDIQTDQSAETMKEEYEDVSFLVVLKKTEDQKEPEEAAFADKTNIGDEKLQDDVEYRTVRVWKED